MHGDEGLDVRLPPPRRDLHVVLAHGVLPEQPERQRVRAGVPIDDFSDGSSSQCDLLVGCDGIKSKVRTQMLETLAKRMGKPELVALGEPFWSGIVAYRGLIPVNRLYKDGKAHRTVTTPTVYCGKSKV